MRQNHITFQEEIDKLIKDKDIFLSVSEIFGPTFQGEGISIGRRCMFLRLAYCPLHCCFCDTAYTWRYNDAHPHVNNTVYNKDKEIRKLLPTSIYQELDKIGCDFLVISGGEPLVQIKNLRVLLEHVYNSGKVSRVEIETAGIIKPTFIDYLPFPEGVNYNVSPKLQSSGNTKEQRYKPDVLKSFLYTDKAIFKFVVTEENDISEIRAIQSEINIPDHLIWIMVEGATSESQISKLKVLGQIILEKTNWNITPRLHTLMWENKRET